eukprot:14836195-Heterocapsa_arctica.AAC.1
MPLCPYAPMPLRPYAPMPQERLGLAPDWQRKHLEEDATMLDYTILYYNISYHAILLLYHIIPCCTITMPYDSRRGRGAEL